MNIKTFFGVYFAPHIWAADVRRNGIWRETENGEEGGKDYCAAD